MFSIEMDCISHSLNSFCSVAFVQMLLSGLCQASSLDLEFIHCFLVHIPEIPISHAKCLWSPSPVSLENTADIKFTALLTIQAHFAYYPLPKYSYKDTWTHKYLTVIYLLIHMRAHIHYILLLVTYYAINIVLVGWIQTWRYIVSTLYKSWSGREEKFVFITTIQWNRWSRCFHPRTVARWGSTSGGSKEGTG